MTQDFVSQIEQICHRRQARRLATASCWAVVAVLVTAVGLMLLDWLIRVYTPPARWLLTCSFFVCLAWIIRKWWNQISTSRITPLQVAREVEERYPQFRELITSAFDFAHQADDNPIAGSPSLRRAVVLQARAAADEIDWQEFLPRQPLRSAALAFLAAILALGFITWQTPNILPTGFSRLLNPLSTTYWPRKHNLRFLDTPNALAAGSDLELILEDTKGTLPDSITIHSRLRQQGRWNEFDEEFATSGASFTWRHPNLQQTLQFRATGGDHFSMPWHTVDIVSPPQLQTLEIIIRPPAYTQLPQSTWKPGSSVYAGSGLQVQGKLDQTVAELSLTNPSGERLAIDLAADSQSFSISSDRWVATETQAWSLDAVTSAGVRSRIGEAMTIEVLADRAPEVAFLRPGKDLTVVPTARVELELEANDDLGLRSLALTYSREKSQQPKILPLWSSNSTAESSKHIQTTHDWHLAELDLVPGDSLEYGARTMDAQPATGQTVRNWRLQVVTEEDLWNQLIDEQMQIAAEIAKLSVRQQALQNEVARWQELPEWSLPHWTNAGHSTLYQQRQIVDTLGEGSLSVITQLSSILKAIERNHLSRPAAVERLQAVQQILQELASVALPSVEGTLSELVRQLQRTPPTAEQLPVIGKILDQQAEVLLALRRVSDLLMPGNSLGKLQQELALLKSDQEALTAQCREALPSLILPDVNSGERSAQFAQASQQQSELAGRFADWLWELSGAVDQLIDEQPTLAAQIASTRALAQELAVQVSLQQSAEELAGYRYGRAATLQAQLIKDLAKLQSRLAGQDQQENADRLDQLRSAERELQRLRREVAKLERQLKQLSEERKTRELERLRIQRESQAKESEQLARKLERLRLPQAPKTVKQATKQLRQPAITQQTTRQARQSLDQAQRQVSTERRRQHVALARLEMARMSARLRRFVPRSQALHEELLRLSALRQGAAQLTMAQRESVQRIADAYANLREEVSEQANQLTTLPIFKHLLLQTVEWIHELEDQLRDLELGEPSLQLSSQIVQRFSQLAKALEQQQQALAPKKPSGGKGGGQGGNGGDKPQSEALQLALGQLQLLRALQTDLREQTESLTVRPNEPSVREKMLQLAQQQQQLSELAGELMPEPEDPPVELPAEDFDLERELQESLGP